MQSESNQPRDEPAFDFSAWQISQGPGRRDSLPPRTARLGSLCHPHRATTAPAPAERGPQQARTAGSTHADAAAPACPLIQPDSNAGIAPPVRLLVPACTNTQGMAFPVHTRRGAAQARPEVNSMIAAALASHVQQRVTYRQPQLSYADAVWPEHAFRSHLFPDFSPAATPLPSYHDTFSPRIQYIEDEVVGPEPPDEPIEAANLISMVKVEPCNSIHNLGTGSPGYSVAVANTAAMLLGHIAPESAAVDSERPRHPACAGPAEPHLSRGTWARTHTGQRHAAHSTSCATAVDVQVDALAILADVALAEANEVDEIAAALEGSVAAAQPAPDPQHALEVQPALQASIAPASCAREEVRKTRCLPLSALIAPVAPQKKARKAGAQIKKRKAAQPDNPIPPPAAAGPHKAQRTTQAAQKTPQPAEDTSSDTPAELAASQPAPVAARVELAPAPPRPVQLHTDELPRRQTLPPLAAALPPAAALQPAAAPLPQLFPGTAQPAGFEALFNGAAAVVQLPQLPHRPSLKHKTGQLAAMQTIACAQTKRARPKHTAPEPAGAPKCKRQAILATALPECRKQRWSAAGLALDQVQSCTSGALPRQARDDRQMAMAATSTDQQTEPPSTQLAQLGVEAGRPSLDITAAQGSLARATGFTEPDQPDHRTVAAMTRAAINSAATSQQPLIPTSCHVEEDRRLAAGRSAEQQQGGLASAASCCEPATHAATVFSNKVPDRLHGSVDPPGSDAGAAADSASQCGPGGTRKHKSKPKSAASADNTRAPPKKKRAVVSVDPAVAGVTNIQATMGPTPTAVHKAASIDALAVVAAQGSSAAADPAKEASMPGAGSPDQTRFRSIYELETAKMAMKLQLHAEKVALRSETKTTPFRRRSSHMSQSYPLLDGIPKRKGVYYRCAEWLGAVAVAASSSQCQKIEPCHAPQMEELCTSFCNVTHTSRRLLHCARGKLAPLCPLIELQLRECLPCSLHQEPHRAAAHLPACCMSENLPCSLQYALKFISENRTMAGDNRGPVGQRWSQVSMLQEERK